jgi:hypothetical protein
MQETISVLTSKLSFLTGPQTVIINNDDTKHYIEKVQQAQIVQENSKLDTSH